MPNAWIEHVRKFSKENNMKYGDALRDEDCKKAYRKSKEQPKPATQPEEPVTQPEEPATQPEQNEQSKEKKVKKEKKKKKKKEKKKVVVFK
jgi:hypothetical protein